MTASRLGSPHVYEMAVYFGAPAFVHVVSLQWTLTSCELTLMTSSSLMHVLASGSCSCLNVSVSALVAIDCC